MKSLLLILLLLANSVYASEVIEYVTVDGQQFVVLDGNINIYIDDNPEANIDDVLSKIDPEPLTLIVIRSGGGSEHLFATLMNGLVDKATEVKMIIVGECSSACTFIAPMANEAIAVHGESMIRVHRTSFTWGDSTWTNKSEDQAAEYGAYGASETWFLNNSFVFSDDNSLYELTSQQAINSGLVDKYIERQFLPKTIQSLLINYN